MEASDQRLEEEGEGGATREPQRQEEGHEGAGHLPLLWQHLPGIHRRGALRKMSGPPWTQPRALCPSNNGPNDFQSGLAQLAGCYSEALPSGLQLPDLSNGATGHGHLSRPWGPDAPAFLLGKMPPHLVFLSPLCSFVPRVSSPGTLLVASTLGPLQLRTWESSWALRNDSAACLVTEGETEGQRGGPRIGLGCFTRQEPPSRVPCSSAPGLGPVQQ